MVSGEQGAVYEGLLCLLTAVTECDLAWTSWVLTWWGNEEQHQAQAGIMMLVSVMQLQPGILRYTPQNWASCDFQVCAGTLIALHHHGTVQRIVLVVARSDSILLNPASILWQSDLEIRLWSVCCWMTDKIWFSVINMLLVVKWCWTRFWNKSLQMTLHLKSLAHCTFSAYNMNSKYRTSSKLPPMPALATNHLV